MLNRDIKSRFVVDDEEYEYKIYIRVEGPDERRREILENLSFDIEGCAFWGLPIQEGMTSSCRIVFVSSSPSQETLIHFR